MLSHPLRIIALVGHYPTNKLVRRSPLPRWNHTFDPKILSGITHSFPWLFRASGYVTTRYSPFRRFRQLCIATQLTFARLACLIHAANVHSEPESNPSIGIYMNVDKPNGLLRLTRLRYEPFETDLNG
jgi:hypothetical protein